MSRYAFVLIGLVVVTVAGVALWVQRPASVATSDTPAPGSILVSERGLVVPSIGTAAEMTGVVGGPAEPTSVPGAVSAKTREEAVAETRRAEAEAAALSLPDGVVMQDGTAKKAKGPYAYAQDVEVMRALVESGGTDAVPTMARYLGHGESTLRIQAALGLIELGDTRALPYLEAAVRNAASEAEAALFRQAITVLGDAAE